jgi:hypothetical protein
LRFGFGFNWLRQDGKQIRTWGSIYVGSSSRPQTGGQTLTNEASIEGRFRFAGKKPGL